MPASWSRGMAGGAVAVVVEEARVMEMTKTEQMAAPMSPVRTSRWARLRVRIRCRSCRERRWGWERRMMGECDGALGTGSDVV